MRPAPVLVPLFLIALGSVGCAPPTWTALHEEVIAPSCALSLCHAPGGNVDAFDLADPQIAYENLIDVPGEVGGSADFVRVVPGDPDNSLLVMVIESGLGEDVRVMPPGLPLKDSQISAIKSWISAGARND